MQSNFTCHSRPETAEQPKGNGAQERQCETLEPLRKVLGLAGDDTRTR